MKDPTQPSLRALSSLRELRHLPSGGGDRQYPYLSNYVSSQVRMGDGSWQAAVLGASAGVIFGAMGGAIGVLVGGLNWPPGPVVSVAGTVAISLWVTLAINLRGRRDKAQQELARLRLGSRPMLYRLFSSSFSGSFETFLPASVLAKLEEGAKAWSDTKAALDSPTWEVASSDSVWASAKDKASRSVEAAMSRLLILAGEPESEARQTSFDTVIGEMRAVADQTVRLSTRHYRPESEPGVSGLRDALGELHMLAAAEDELTMMSEQPLGETDPR